MNIISVDPGRDIHAFSIFSDKTLLHIGLFDAYKIDFFRSIIKRFNIKHIYIESMFVYKNHFTNLQLIESQIRLKTWCEYIFNINCTEINNTSWQNRIINMFNINKKISKNKKYKYYQEYIESIYKVKITDNNIVAASCIGDYALCCEQ